jgi:hypothetical protein
MDKVIHSPTPVINEKQASSRPQTSRTRAASLPEVDLYIHLIVLLYLIDRNSLKAVNASVYFVQFVSISFDMHAFRLVHLGS